MEMFKNIAKGAIIFGAVGLLLALSAPAIAGIVGIIGGEAAGAGAAKIAAGAYANALYEGAFFAVFGALVPPIEKIYALIFGDDKKEKAQEAATEKSAMRASTITIEMSPEQEREVTEGLTNFRDRVKHGRVTEDSCRSA